MSQARNESFSNFLVRIEQFFLCRTIPFTEQEKFEIIWYTMRSDYRDRLSLITVENLRHLEDLCDRIDANDENLMNKFNFAFDSKKINEVNIPITPTAIEHKQDSRQFTFSNSNFNNNSNNRQNYNNQNRNNNRNQQIQNNRSIYSNQNQNNNRNQYHQQNSLNQPYEGKNNTNTNRNNNSLTNNNRNSNTNLDSNWRNVSKENILKYYRIPDQKVCLNCRKFGHHFTTCFFKRQVFCYVCGLPDFHYEECPFCEAKNSRREN
uniref:(northern house mosquito) hypothetical protein n=1 Tax=Culex pipiens TaxID=7175 RepID=A0A8D8GC71_CULPI